MFDFSVSAFLRNSSRKIALLVSKGTNSSKIIVIPLALGAISSRKIAFLVSKGTNSSRIIVFLVPRENAIKKMFLIPFFVNLGQRKPL